MSGRQTHATAPRVSFGVELEFLVAFVRQGEPDPDESIKDQIQPLVVVPVDKNIPSSSIYGNKTLSFQDAQTVVFNRIRNTLSKAGLPVEATKYAVEPGSVQESHGQNGTSSFRVKDDPSLDEVSIDGYRFQRVELISPAMYDMDVSFDLVRLAVSVITTNFRCRVNPSCGFHVHVGAGPTQRIDPRALRNLAALLWAADPLVSRLHPPWRSINGFSQSGRVNNVTALGANEDSADVLLKHTAPRQRGIDGSLLPGAPPTANSSLSPDQLKMLKYLGRDRQLGESVEPSMEEATARREIDMDTVDDIAALEREPWTHRTPVPPVDGSKPAEALPNDPVRSPKIYYEAPAPLPATYGKQQNSERNPLAPARPRPPPIHRRYPRVPGTMRPDTRDDANFLAPHLSRHRQNALMESPGALVPPHRQDVMSGVRDILGADMTAAQVGELMRHRGLPKQINYKFWQYGMCAFKDLSNRVGASVGLHEDFNRPSSAFQTMDNTIEFREAAGSLDVEWIATWAKICCRLLEWSRDAPPAEYMGVIRLLAWAQEEEDAEYDVVDFLVDLGLVAEARFCEERLHQGEAAWYECLNVLPGADSDDESDAASSGFPSEPSYEALVGSEVSFSDSEETDEGEMVMIDGTPWWPEFSGISEGQDC